jgi:hypothetical protein
MIFRDALVDMEGGAIYTDMFFKAEGVNFYSAGSAGNIWIWYSQAQIQNCRFQNINYFGMWSKFVVNIANTSTWNTIFMEEVMTFTTTPILDAMVKVQSFNWPV